MTHPGAFLAGEAAGVGGGCDRLRLPALFVPNICAQCLCPTYARLALRQLTLDVAN